MRIGIRWKLVTTLIITGVIPLLIAISITYFVEISQRQKIIGQNFQQLSAEARDRIMLRLTASVRAIRNLSVLPITVDFLRNASLLTNISPTIVEWQIGDVEQRWSKIGIYDEPLQEILGNQLAKTLQAFNSVEIAFGEVFATDVAGRLVASTDKTSDYWQADEEWWKRTYNNDHGQLYLTDITYDESIDQYSTSICMPVRVVEDGQERVVGVIKGVLAASYVFESISNIRVSEGGRGALMARDGTTMIVSGGNLVPQHPKLPPGLRPSTSQGNSDWFVATDPYMSDTLVGFARIELDEIDFSFSTPWSVIVYQELRHAYAPVRRLVWYVALAGAALILVFFFLGLSIMEKKIASPLSLLTQTVKRVASGDLTRTVEIKSNDEIGELTSSFNQMVSNLEKRISLDNMSMDMLSHLKLSDVLNMTMETLKATFNAAFTRLWLIGDGDICHECVHADICSNRERCLHLEVSVGIYAKDEEYFRVPLGGLKVGEIAEIGRPSLVNDLMADESIHNAQWLHSRWITSFAGYPLIRGNELLGAIALFTRKPISNEEFIILGSFADRAAMAIQNAELHSEVNELNLNLEKTVEGRTQELRQVNIKLRRADQLKSEFLANMSHELRTPLNAIIGFSEIMRDGLCGQLNDDQMESILDIHASGKHLLTMINDILDLSKVEAGKMELQPDIFSVAETMDSIQSTVRDMASQKRMKLQTAVPEDLPDIYADHVKFKQIMYNLLSNAVKFTPEGGTVTVDVGFHDDEFLISVTDTGIGIRSEDQNTIFDEFRQLDSSLSRQYEGTGLGLSLTRKLVELHGGKIWVESEGKGMGSKFSFTLPRGKPDDYADEAHMLPETGQSVAGRVVSRAYTEDAEWEADSPGTGLSARTVLVVEDSLEASQLLCIYLNEAGYDTVIAVDGEEAVEMARKIKPFAITLDIMLPKKDGWQVIQELKRFQDTRHIPIIIISIVDDLTFGFSMGAVDYLTKPIDREQLSYALKKLEAQETTPRILVIDDDAKDLRMMEAVLHNEGFEVLTATNGARGVAEAIQEHPDLIILDLLMPGASGFDVVKTLQQHPEARDIPIIICTVKDLTAADREVLNSKVQSVVYKGEDAKLHLLEAVRRIEQFHVDRTSESTSEPTLRD